MSNLIQVEFRRILQLRTLPLLVLLACFFSYALLDKLFQSGDSIDLLRSSGQAAVHTEFRLNNKIFGSVILAALFLGSDFTQRTLYQQLAHGHSRSELVLAKAFVYSIVGSVLLMITPLITITIVTWMNGWGTAFNLAEASYVLRVFGLAFLLNTTFLNVFVFISFLCRDVQKTLIVSGIFAVISLDIGSVLANASPKFAQFYRYLPSQQLQIIAQRNVTSSEILLALVVTVSTWSIFTAAAIYIFKNQDLT